MGMEGSVCSLPNAKGDLYVQMGILRSQVNIKDLDIIPDKDDNNPNYSLYGRGRSIIR